MKYLIQQVIVNSNDSNFETLLAACHQRRERPLCMCKLSGVEMYVAKINQHFFLKRMPGTGVAHDFKCTSFEPPAELSGLGVLVGSAIKENRDNDLTKIKVDFSLSKGEGRKAPVMGEGNSKPGEVTADASKLTMRALLHYLYEQSGLNKFEPSFENRRSWFYIRKVILQAAANKIINGNPLSNMLFIPEPFVLDKKEEIKIRRNVELSPAVYKGYGKREMMIIIGEVKEILPDSYGYKIVIKHLPDLRFRIPDDLHKKITEKYDNELDIWKELQAEGHLLLMGTFFLDIRGYAHMETCTLQITDKNWIIIENHLEAQIVNALNDQKRSYVKGLRYNLKEDTPFASVVLRDTTPPTAMYLHREDAKDVYGSRLESMTGESTFESWIWETQENMPAVPEKAL